MWMIQKVGFDDQDRIDRVQWQQVEPQQGLVWLGEPEVVPVVAVVDRVKSGKVGSVFTLPGGDQELGPYAMVISGDRGYEWIDADNADKKGRTLRDLDWLS